MLSRLAIAAFLVTAVSPAQQLIGNVSPGPGSFMNRGVYSAHQIERQQIARVATVLKPDVVVLVGDTVIPQVVDGAGWKTTFKFVNLNNYLVTFRLLFFADDGSDLNLPIVGVGNNISLDITLPVAGSIDIETTGESSVLSQGWAQMVLQNSADSIGGFAIFRQSIPGLPDQEAAVPVVNQFDNHFALIYDNTGPFVTGIAIANASPSSPVTVPVNIRDVLGNIVDSRTISLGPEEHMAFVLPSTWPSTAGQQGVIEFLVSDLGVGALGLRFNGPAFTSFPILSNYNWIVQ